MKLAIVQPNFFPFKAYYDLAKRVDKFIFLDDTPYNNKSWVNKTLIKIGKKNYYFRIPLEYDPNSVTLTKDLNPKNDKWKKKFLKLIKVQYKKSPNFNLVFPILKEIINIPSECLAHTSSYSVFRIASTICSANCQFTFSSIKYKNVKISYWDKILHICKKEKATSFYTFSSNKKAFDERKFFTNDINISFFTSHYDRFSIIDHLMTSHSYRPILEKECNLLQDETERPRTKQ